MSDRQDAAAPADPLFLADHLALDMLNTEARAGEGWHDFWQDGRQLLRWLELAGIDIAGVADQDALLAAARELRAAARELVAARKEGRRGDPARLNAWLALLESRPVLEWEEDGPRLGRRYTAVSPLQPLGVLAEAVARLLSEGEFELVRQCEHRDCVLWFYDRTKSHRRRWCSMAVCGNRHKAEQFRRRSGGAA